VSGTRRERLAARFGSPAPLVAVVHLPPSPGCVGFHGADSSERQLAADLDTLSNAGVDGVLLENENDKPHTLTASPEQERWLARLAGFARRQLTVPLGINVQRIDWQAALRIAAKASLDMVRLDVFVDRVRMLDRTVQVDPLAVRQLRDALGAERVQLWTDVQVKHAEVLEPRPLAVSAGRAFAEGADAVLVTGARTGEAPRRDELGAARSADGDSVTLIGSGLDAANASTLAAHADGALVGTALKRGERIDAERTAKVVAAWRAACAVG
jgi:membrane complex biogenesis BtpA family protein